MTPAERAFYEWYHVHGSASVSTEQQREIWLAGWDAAAAFIAAAFEPEPEPEPAAEAERVADVFDQAATDYATIEDQQ